MSNQTQEPEEPQITITLPRKAALALARASIHYRAWMKATPSETEETVSYLDAYYRMLKNHPDITDEQKRFLRELRACFTQERD